MPQPLTVTISSLGRKGDGLAETEDGPVHIPYTLPGEIVRIEGSGNNTRLVSVEKPSPNRIAPVCKHFGSCGGCLLQHLSAEHYLDFKRSLVASALRSRGLELPVSPVSPVPLHTRRRAVVTAVRAGKRVILGFNKRKGRDVIDVEECPILRSQLTDALPLVRQLCEIALPKKGQLKLTLLETDTGLDVAMKGLAKNADRLYPQLAQAIVGSTICRLTADGETVIQIEEPVLDMDGVKAHPVAGGFAQAAAEAERRLATHVFNACGHAKKVVDLFAGMGTFSLRLAKKCHVHAVEGDRAALSALTKAARAQAHLKPVSMEARDLFHRPLLAAELAPFDAVVFDPPRAGAQSQADQIAQSTVPVVVAVSCNPATLARDLRILIDGGYQAEAIHPVDQFLFSPHIEVVAVLRRTS